MNARETLKKLRTSLCSSFQRRLESSFWQIAEELDPSLRWDDGLLIKETPNKPLLVIPAQAGIQFLADCRRTGSQSALG